MSESFETFSELFRYLAHEATWQWFRFDQEVRSRIKPKPRQILAPCGKPCRTRRGNKKLCVSPRSRLRFTLKAGTKVGAVQA